MIGMRLGVKSVLGFLDPMRYLCHRKDGPYTSQTDHRRWLWRFRPWRTSLVVQFTGNNDAASLAEELQCLRADLEAIGFAHWMEVRRQHYVVSVGSQALDLVGKVVRQRVVRSWNEWCDSVDEIKTRDLSIAAASGRLIPALGGLSTIMASQFVDLFRGTSDRAKFLARVFGIFSEKIVRVWSASPDAPYEDLGRPTVQFCDETTKSTLDFTFRHRNPRKIYVAEMKCGD